MKRIAPSLALLIVGACSEAPERVYMVDDLIADADLLAETIKRCRNNPGELGDTANCKNAEAAGGKLRLIRTQNALGG